MKYLVAFCFLLIGSVASAQSSFKPIPKPATSVVRPFAAIADSAVVTPIVADSTTTAFRFIADIAAYSEPGNIAMAGVGYGYQKLTYSSTSQKWTCNWSVSACAFAGGSVVPSTPASVMSVGVLGGILNNTIMAGPVYNFGTKQFGAALSIGINLNN
jgi:hypothetical protein